MGQSRAKAKSALHQVDPVWERIRHEAEEIVRREPELATFIYSTILHHDRLEAAVIHRITPRLDHPDGSAGVIPQASDNRPGTEPPIRNALRARILATGHTDS